MNEQKNSSIFASKSTLRISVVIAVLCQLVYLAFTIGYFGVYNIQLILISLFFMVCCIAIDVVYSRQHKEVVKALAVTLIVGYFFVDLALVNETLSLSTDVDTSTVFMVAMRCVKMLFTVILFIGHLVANSTGKPQPKAVKTNQIFVLLICALIILEIIIGIVIVGPVSVALCLYMVFQLIAELFTMIVFMTLETLIEGYREDRERIIG